MDKIRVLFPYVEAGFGHIMPTKAIEESFRRKYGDKVEIISSRFFTESGNKHLCKYEKLMGGQVKMYNRFRLIGYLSSGAPYVFGTVLTSFAAMRAFAPLAFKAGVKHMEELAPDIVFSTHWVTNYYAQHTKKPPFSIVYCPDAQANPMFEYKCDLNLISMPYGYEKELRRKKHNIQNYKLVPFLIRNSVFDIPKDKKLMRRKLGLPENNFTVILCEGGYGIGKTEAICKLLIKEHIHITVISMCGKNEKMLKRLKALTPTEEVTFLPLSFTEQILEYQAASDVFCGKSGNMIAEATFFGVVSIITRYSTIIEHDIADHYIHTVGCAIKEFSPKRVVKLLKEFAADSQKLNPYKNAAISYHDRFGADEAADILWETVVACRSEVTESSLSPVQFL